MGATTIEPVLLAWRPLICFTIRAASLLARKTRYASPRSEAANANPRPMP